MNPRLLPAPSARSAWPRPALQRPPTPELHTVGEPQQQRAPLALQHLLGLPLPRLGGAQLRGQRRQARVLALQHRLQPAVDLGGGFRVGWASSGQGGPFGKGRWIVALLLV